MNSLLMPLVALLTWTLVIWAWMILTRVPAIFKMKMHMDPKAKRGEQMSLLPAEVRWKADNYNNLMEQPTVYYALIIALILMNDTHQLTLLLAWMYVALRIIHSLIHATSNNIKLRFGAFVTSGLVLVVLVYRAIEILVLQKAG